METIRKGYVSAECAKLLKEKGYPQDYCVGTLCRIQNEVNKYYECVREITNGDIHNAWCIFNEVYPTLCDVQNWLRKEKSIYIIIEPHYSTKYSVVEHSFAIMDTVTLILERNKKIKSKLYYEKYEQCLNGAIMEALKLI